MALNCLRLIAITLCICIAAYQLSECCKKIFNPPISTHYKFELNDRMQFPTVTFCRNPPYKESVFKEYGLPSAHPTLNGIWKYYNFNKSLDEFFDKATYNRKELFGILGLNQSPTNVEIEESFKLQYGRCFTVKPKHPATKWDEMNGFFISLHHTTKPRDNKKLAGVDSVAPNLPFGYHFHIHESNEIITDLGRQDESFIEYVYVEAGEDLTLSLKTSSFMQTGKDRLCNNQQGYSKIKCKEMCLHELVTDEISCSTPWMENKKQRRCNNADQIKAIIDRYDYYSSNGFEHHCNCPKRCHITLFTPNLQKRIIDGRNACFLSLYYSSNLVTTMEEIIGYDWNLFLSDLGGSLGFFLGLSVVGIIELIECIIKSCRCKKLNIDKVVGNENNNSSRDIEWVSPVEHY